MVSHELKERIKNEFNLLTQTEQEKQYSQSQFFPSYLQQNIQKNRYKNIPAYESTRVKLLCDYCQMHHQDYHFNCNMVNDDYIHGNYISSPLRDKHYIACQAPLPQTALSFWRMIWQHNVKLVIMLTLIEEDGCVKSHQYFPDSSFNAVMTFGDYLVLLTSKTCLEGGVIIRELSLKNLRFPDEEKRIYHAQYCNWPDQSVPDSIDEIFSLIHMINNVNNVNHSPIVVHCSAGIGRTGTIIAIMNCIVTIRMNGNCDVAQTVLKLREERYGSVTAIAQYKFIYKVILAYISKFCIFSKNNNVSNSN